jgi:SAM-dependent methyltransferase
MPAQLVLHFVTDPAAVASELRRVVRPGGFVAANVWDFADGMQMLRRFWDAALAVEPTAPDEARTMRFGREGEIVELFVSVGLVDVVETMLHVTSTYADFDELWSGFMAGIGPAGAFLLSLPDEQRAAVRTELFGRLGAPTGSFTMAAKARCVRGRVPA